MNRLDAILSDVGKRARLVATSAINEGRGVMPMIVAFRGDQEIAVVGLNDHIRDEILQTARLVAGGFAADIIAVTNDSYHSVIPRNPRTGRTWEAGEMQECADYYDGIAQGYVTEALITECVNRTGELAMMIQPYRRGKNRVHWEPKTVKLMENIGGIMPDALRAAMTENPPMVEDVVEHWEPGEARDVGDAITSMLLNETTGAIVMLTAPPDGRRARRIAEFFESRGGAEVMIVPPLFGVN